MPWFMAVRPAAVALVLGLVAGAGVGCTGDRRADEMLSRLLGFRPEWDDRLALDPQQLAHVTPDSMPARFTRSFNDMAAGTRASMTSDLAGYGRAWKRCWRCRNERTPPPMRSPRPAIASMIRSSEMIPGAPERYDADRAWPVVSGPTDPTHGIAARTSSCVAQ